MAKKLNPQELDEMADRLEKLNTEVDEIRGELKAQIDEHGFVPPRAEKSKRLEGDIYKATLSYGTATTVIDTEVEKILEACGEELGAKLFKAITKYSVVTSAHQLLAGTLPEGAPRNLRQMFERAVQISEKAPSLKVEKKKGA